MVQLVGILREKEVVRHKTGGTHYIVASVNPRLPPYEGHPAFQKGGPRNLQIKIDNATLHKIYKPDTPDVEVKHETVTVYNTLNLYGESDVRAIDLEVVTSREFEGWKIRIASGQLMALRFPESEY